MSSSVATTTAFSGASGAAGGKVLPAHGRARNRSLILQTLLAEGAMSRADLARRSGLTRPTVSGLVAELEAEELVAELGPRDDARIGKPAILVDLDGDAYHLIAVDLSLPDRFEGLVTDLRGVPVHRASIEIDGARGEQAILRVVRLIERLATGTPRRLLGIAVGCPGVVDEDGCIIDSKLLDLGGRPVREQLAEHFRVPVHVLNDANLAALGVHAFEPAPTGDLVVVALEHGVGMGMVLDGRLVRGEHAAAGEIGHLTVDPVGPPCLCGRNGCLEVLIGADDLAARLARASTTDRAGVLADAGEILGGVLAPVISAVDVTEVVITGPVGLVEGAFTEAVGAAIRLRSLARVGDHLSVTAAPATSDLVLRGGAAFLRSAELGVA